jgi:hypothetical protein
MAESREPTLRVTMLPRDTNARGTIFGGVILSHIRLSRRDCRFSASDAKWALFTRFLSGTW